MRWRIFYRHRSTRTTGEWQEVAQVQKMDLLVAVADGIRYELCPESDIACLDTQHNFVRYWLVGQRNVNEVSCSDRTTALSCLSQTLGLEIE